MNKHFFSNARRMIVASTLVISTLFFTGCGKTQQYVTDINLATYMQEGDIYAEFGATLNLGNLTLPGLTLPYNDPRTGEMIGQVTLAPTVSGLNEIDLAVNISHAANLPAATAAKLPNGQALPIGGLNNAKIVQYAVPGTQALVYVALDSKVAIAGVAIPIKEMDSIGASMGGVNFFPSFKIKGVLGVAGIFTGSSAGQTGIAVFVDLSSVVNPTDILAGMNLKSASVSTSSLSIATQSPSSSKLSKLQQMLYALSKKSIVVTVK